RRSVASACQSATPVRTGRAGRGRVSRGLCFGPANRDASTWARLDQLIRDARRQFLVDHVVMRAATLYRAPSNFTMRCSIRREIGEIASFPPSGGRTTRAKERGIESPLLIGQDWTLEKG